MGMLAALLLIMAYTPLGYLNIGALAITFNTIPVAIAAYSMGVAGGGIIGGVFGLTSFFYLWQKRYITHLIQYLGWQIIRCHYAAVYQNAHAFHEVFQLTHISRPVVLIKSFLSLR